MKFLVYGIAGIAACRAISVLALLLRLRRNPSAGTQERERGLCTYGLCIPSSVMTQLHLLVQACTQQHTWTLTHSTVNKAMQSGNNHKQTTTICLFVSACRSQWASLATDHTTLPKHNNVQHHGFKKSKNKIYVKGVQPFVISLPLSYHLLSSFPTLSLPLFL